MSSQNVKSEDKRIDDKKKEKIDGKEITKGVNNLKISSRDPLIIVSKSGVSYECVGRVGKGSFGIVYKAIEKGTSRIVAIKRVLQDPRYKNRELQIMKMVNHPNTVELIDSFYERDKDKVYLNLVLGYVPKNLYEVCDSYTRHNKHIPIYLIQIYIYQLLRSLAYVHSLGICHRDIKPQNLLINVETNELKLCDFGSAKILVPGEPNVAYICSRYYRAPELVFGATEYTPAIDIWSSGCVMAELILGRPLFAGENGMDQLMEIVKVLGTPPDSEILQMNKDYKIQPDFPNISPHPLPKIFPLDTPKTAIDLLSKTLLYVPSKRIKPLEACAHKFFDDLRKPTNEQRNYKIPNHLFNFSPEEIASANKQGILDILLPSTVSSQNYSNSYINDIAQNESSSNEYTPDNDEESSENTEDDEDDDDENKDK